MLVESLYDSLNGAGGGGLSGESLMCSLTVSLQICLCARVGLASQMMLV